MSPQTRVQAQCASDPIGRFGSQNSSPKSMFLFPAACSKTCFLFLSFRADPSFH